MTEGSISRKIILFAIPLFFGNLFQQLYNTADSLIVGNFLISVGGLGISPRQALTVFGIKKD